MTMQCLIFGAIGAVAETSDLQRQAFNLAFREAGLGWNWDTNTYQGLLRVNGGQNRIRHYAGLQNDTLTDAAIRDLHASKTNKYEAILSENSLSAREGVASLIKTAKAASIAVGMASTTSDQNIDAIFKALKDIEKSDFDFVLSGKDAEAPKPAPHIYLTAIKRSAKPASQIIVIEDSPVSAQAAIDAGLVTLIYPGETVSHQDMSVADAVIGAEHLSLDYLNTLTLKTA